MDKEEEWSRFTRTGKVDDYLKFSNSYSEDNNSENCKANNYEAYDSVQNNSNDIKTCGLENGFSIKSKYDKNDYVSAEDNNNDLKEYDGCGRVDLSNVYSSSYDSTNNSSTNYFKNNYNSISDCSTDKYSGSGYNSGNKEDDTSLNNYQNSYESNFDDSYDDNYDETDDYDEED